MSCITIVGVGQMGLSAMRILASRDPAIRFSVIDRNEANLSTARNLGACVEHVSKVDISTDDLDFSGADLVLNFAGPFFTGSDIVARAALRAKAPYIDVGDDVEATRAILALDREAKSAGVALITGAGFSPGVSNWLAVQILSANPQCDEIKIAWVTHEPDPGGLAPLRHMLHMAVSPCPIWKDGEMVDTPGFDPSTSESFAFPAPFGLIEAQDTSHPEPLTLSRHFPHLRQIGCKGALRPAWANAAFSTLGKIGFGYTGERVSYGTVEIEPADFLWRLMWQRHNRRPPRVRVAETGVMVIGLEDGKVVERRAIIDEGDMSRGTGLGAAAAALTLMKNKADPGASGVEALDAQAGVDLFIDMARENDSFARGVIVSN